MESRDGIDYYKTVPQTSDPILGLGIREDGTHPHAYMYQCGSEVNKERERIDIPEGHVKTVTYSGKPIFVKLPETSATASFCARGSNLSSMSIDHKNEGVWLEADATATISVACFNEKNGKYNPIPIDD